MANAEELMMQAKAIEAMVQALRDWGRLLDGKIPYTDPATGHAVFRDVPDPTRHVTETDRQATREVYALVGEHVKVLRGLLNEHGCHPFLREPLTRLLDEASMGLGGQDRGGYWVRARDYTDQHLCGEAKPVSIPDEMRKWAERLRQEARRPTGLQVPWRDDAPEYIPAAEARKLMDEEVSLQTLGRLCKGGHISYMRKGRRRKLHLGDLRKYLQSQQRDEKWAAAYMLWMRGAKSGKNRMFWECTACGLRYPETGMATPECPKCCKPSKLIAVPPPKKDKRRR
ncbi:MAG: hypothetical protein BWX88_02017 [Planctomycetes bacterium ADurb.Bin126]|nr:MAG: hypothetical protein BWX88_02017 [Planctomycetes bacterium ADurb.Bin126]